MDSGQDNSSHSTKLLPLVAQQFSLWNWAKKGLTWTSKLWCESWEIYSKTCRFHKLWVNQKVSMFRWVVCLGWVKKQRKSQFHCVLIVLCTCLYLQIKISLRKKGESDRFKFEKKKKKKAQVQHWPWVLSGTFTARWIFMMHKKHQPVSHSSAAGVINITLIPKGQTNLSAYAQRQTRTETQEKDIHCLTFSCNTFTWGTEKRDITAF